MELLQDSFVYLFAAVAAVPVANRLGLGSVLGYLIAGIVIGLFAPIWVAAIAAGAVSGAVQPVLFKDLKYA